MVKKSEGSRKAQARASTEASFEVEKLPKVEGQNAKYRYRCKFCKNFDRIYEGSQRPQEHILWCNIHGKAAKGCENVPPALRDELRALLDIVPFEEPKGKLSQQQTTGDDLKTFIEQKEIDHLNKLKSKAMVHVCHAI